MALNPGESTTVGAEDFTMPEGMGGPHNFAIHLLTNDVQRPDLVVHFLANWGP